MPNLTLNRYLVFVNICIQCSATRGRQYPRAVHGGSALGHRDGRHRGVAHDGAVPHDARHLHQGGHAGQAGHAQRVRMPRLQSAVSVRQKFFSS